MAYSSEIARSYWNEQQADAAPTYEHLADRVISKSRKAHQCDACKGSIAKGSSYRTSVFILDGDFIVEKYHRHQCVGW
jgi:hypothetical protein